MGQRIDLRARILAKIRDRLEKVREAIQSAEEAYDRAANPRAEDRAVERLRALQKERLELEAEEAFWSARQRR